MNSAPECEKLGHEFSSEEHDGVVSVATCLHCGAEETSAQASAESLVDTHQLAHSTAGTDVLTTGKVLLHALRNYGFPVSASAYANTRNGLDMSREAHALHLAAEAFAQAVLEAA
jgi:hypothetical protein